MAEQRLQLEIVTPQGLVLSAEVDEVVAPSVNGEFGVLPGHLPLLAALHIGLLHYRKGNKLTDVAVGSGFAEVLHDKAIVLTDRYTTKDAVDVLAVRKKLKDVDNKLERWDGDLDDPERMALIEEEQWLAVQLELYGDPPQNRVLVEMRTNDYSDVIPEVEAPASGGLRRAYAPASGRAYAPAEPSADDEG
jgi:F-type H+-transporting ATPase subunit epsilon